MDTREYHQFCISLQRAAIKNVETYVKIAESKLDVYIPMPKVIFKNMGSVAGRAYINENVIALHPQYMRNHSEDFLVQTVGHEVAHIISFAQKRGIKPHGDEWRRVMWAFSLPATRCHNYNEIQAGRVKVVEARETSVGTVTEKRGAKIITFD